MVTHHDLVTAHEALESGPGSISLRLVLLRHVMLEIANVAEIAAMSRALFKSHPQLGSMHHSIANALEFFKYLRNKYVGHFVKDLSDITFEWMPMTYFLVGSKEVIDQGTVSWFALETAINTYTDAQTNHRIFDSDTDLNFPPDQTRFLNYVKNTALQCIAFISALIEITRENMEVPNMETEAHTLAIKAGQTEFRYISKGKR